MRTPDGEVFQIEYLQDIPSSRVKILGNYFRCKSILRRIKKSNNWINTSGKNDPPPDFYSNKYKLMMDAMAINDVEYIKNGKIINNQKGRQHKILQQTFGMDYKNPKDENERRDDLRVFYNYDLSQDKHDYKQYQSSFKRVVEKHRKSINLYRKNHPGYKLIFYIFDESVEFIGDYRGKSVIHICFNDAYFVDILKKLEVDYVVWITSVKIVCKEKNDKEIKIPMAAIYEVKKLSKYRFADYSIYNLKPIKL